MADLLLEVCTVAAALLGIMVEMAAVVLSELSGVQAVHSRRQIQATYKGEKHAYQN